MSFQYLPFYPGDYLRDTSHLTTEQHGCYFLLILRYWAKGQLPDDDEQLARIAGLPLGKWLKMRHVIKDLFHDGWKHKRLDIELEKAADRNERSRKAALTRYATASANGGPKLVHSK